ncbi:MAG: hypothetical protein WAM61_12420 [Desulfobacterales bacterium]
MESTPGPQSDNEPRESTEPSDDDRDGRNGGDSAADETPPAALADKTAIEAPANDTRELSAEEVANLISAEYDSPEESDPTEPAAGGTDQKPSDREEESAATEPAPDFQSTAGPAKTAAEADEPRCSGKLLRRGLWAAGLIVLLTVSAAVGFLYLTCRPPIQGTLTKDPPPVAAAVKHDKAAPDIRPPVNILLERLQPQQERMDGLRDRMLAKAEEITRLQQHYRESVDQLEAAVLSQIRYAGIDSLKQALETRRMALQLETIRRRKAYIDCLAKPVDRLRQASEELLFLKRKHRLQALVFPVGTLVDPEKLVAENDFALAAGTRSAEALTVDLKKAPLPDLDHIWQGLIEKEKQAASTGTSRDAAGDARAKNEVIWREMCEGQWRRKGDLTALSIDAADCLTHWKEPDLFLNGIANLSPEVARRLFNWRGTWFCLNGLSEVSAETAPYLFTWQGDWLSLNGLAHLSPEASIFLTGWRGRTLELTGLAPALMEAEVVALKHLAQWQRSGGRLHVSERIRQLIEESRQ